MVGRLEGKVALVTGGTSGIGRGVAARFVAEGARTFVTGRRQSALDETVAALGGSAAGVRGDVADLADLDRLRAQIEAEAGRLDVLFANAGVARHETIAQISEASYEETLRTNVRGVLFAVQKLLPLMPDGAAIVVNASMWTIKGVEGFGLLSASKAALRSLVRTWANELRDRRIRVNAVSPGPVSTPAVERATGGRDGAKTLMDELARGVPLGRVGEPEDIAKAVVFLASDDAGYVNGVELFVDGGMTQI